MKKLMFMAAFAVFGLSNVNAQDQEPTYGFQQNDITIEGHLGYRSTNDKNMDSKTNGF